MEAAYAATLPPSERNSATLVVKLPQPRARGLLEYEYLDQSLRQTTNELQPPFTGRIADAVAADLPADHPVVRELGMSPVGGIPMTDSIPYSHPGWSRLRAIQKRAIPLEYAGASTAAQKEYRATCIYIQAMLNAGRAIGDMPRMHAQRCRVGLAKRASRMTTRMLAWGEPDTELAQLQREFLAEADRLWLKSALRGERAVRERVVPTLSADDEIDLFFFRLTGDGDWRQKLTWSDHALPFVARPYRVECLAKVLRELTRAIDLCDLPPQEQRKAWREMNRRDDHESLLTALRQKWRNDLAVRIDDDTDNEPRALLRTTSVAIACERFRRANGRWPNLLSEIPTSILPAIPLDPYDGKPLRYRVITGGAIVYSIGLHPQREYGIVDFTYQLGTPLWGAALRGKPSSPDPINTSQP